MAQNITLPAAAITANLGTMTPSDVSVQEANLLLNKFSMFCSYRHGEANPHIARIERLHSIAIDRVLAFFCIWYSFSRRTPQILLHAAARCKTQEARRLLMVNYMEEDGLAGPDQDPHYDLLQELIEKMGGSIVLDPRAEALILQFMDLLESPMSEEWVAGLIAGFEHPALDITRILMMVVERAQGGAHKHLLEEDYYLRIHVAVEPDHIRWAHGTCEALMARGQREYDDVTSGFKAVMDFWTSFWALAIGALLDEPGVGEMI